MPRPYTIILIFLIFIYSCSDNTSHYDRHHGIKILTRGPRGSNYTDSTGKEFGFRIFKTHIINDTVVQAELTINFSNDSVLLIPNDSIPSLNIPTSDRYVKVFLFPRSMTPDKHEEVYNYGITGVESFLDTCLGKPTFLKITLQPKQDYILYTGALLYPAFGSARSKLFINGQNLVYKILIEPQLDSALIPCGQIVFKK
ncbi:MAG TPA: hypothetical protein VJY62_14530 [Bacteroidia bacterium]|nr:hypothetical protein [Bacteroidia bacterium]